MARSSALAATLAVAAAPASAAQLIVTLEGMRNLNGQVHVCLTRSPDHFPDCAGDPASIRRTMTTRQGQRFSIDVPPGGWALSVIHDENGNGRLDTRLGIPREGFGFSNNPRIWFGPPSFNAARFVLPAEGGVQNVVMKYML